MPQLSVASYNLYLGADLSLILGRQAPDRLERNLTEVQRQLMATAFPQRAAEIADTLVAHRVDLVGLQEVCCWTLAGEELWDFEIELLDALAQAGATYETVSRVSTFAGEGELASEAGAVPIHLRGSNMVLRRTDSDLEVVEECHGVFAEAHRVHTLGTRSITIDRGWCGVRGRVGDQEVGFVNTHTEAYAAASRDTQRDELLAACAPMRDAPLVVVGDFNAPPDEVGMPEDMVDAWHVNGVDPGWTCCQGPDLSNQDSALRERIDYVWVRGADVVSARLLGHDPARRAALGLWPSDHAGVQATIRIG